MNKDPLIWIMAGETSGDAYGAEIANELRQRTDGKIRLAGMGSVKMRAAGVEILADSAELGLIGFLEVFKMIFTFIRIFRSLEKQAKADRPDLIVFVDYPGFNLRFAKRMEKAGIPVVWYISPKVWAWGKKRIPVLARVCRKLMCIFPFETEFFKDTGVKTEFVGHPLVSMLREKIDPAITRDPDTVVLLPGSRKNEIRYILDPMLITVQKLWLRHPNLKFVIAAANAKTEKQIRAVLQHRLKKIPESARPPIEIRTNETYYWIQRAGTGLAASGTVTVECAIFGLPLVSVYASNYFNFYMAKMLVTLFRDYFTMPNIIMNKCIYEEYMQFCLHYFVLVPAMERILPGGERRDYVVREMQAMTELLTGGTDRAFIKVGDVILHELSEIQNANS